jgi:hypothetical protein
MSYQAQPLEVPANNPFQNDALNRKPLVDFLARLIGNAGGPFVLALDSPWGTGKTTFVQMLQKELERQNFATIYFNAWKVDFATDPLVPLVAALDQIQVGEESKQTFRRHLKAAQKIVTIFAKHALIGTVKASTVGLLDLEEGIENAISEAADDTASDIVEAFRDETDQLETFRRELEHSMNQLQKAQKRPTLVFFIDELDRCRPDFAIRLLERVKHLFDVPNILFVLSVDKSQLEASVAAIYGSGINAREYLRRFIDLEYRLPSVTSEAFVKSLLLRFGIDDVLSASQSKETFLRYFTKLSQAHGLSYRSQEKIMTRLSVILSMYKNIAFPAFIALLLLLRSERNELYQRLSKGEMEYEEIMKYLDGLPGSSHIDEAYKNSILAYLIATDPNSQRVQQKLSELRSALNDPPSKERQYAERILRIVQSIYETSDQLDSIFRTIDFSENLTP